MAKFMIEMSHEPTLEACGRAIEVVLKTGSHFFSQADWGCKDGEHKAWVVVDVDNKNEAQRIVPIVFRNQTRIIELCTFSMEDAESMLRPHKS